MSGLLCHLEELMKSDVTEEKIQCTSHNVLLPIGYFVQVVMWGDTDETCFNCKIGLSSVIKVCFITITYRPL